MSKSSTIHNPVNFEPSDYEVVDWIDNQPPKFYPVFGLYGEALERAYQRQEDERRAWQKRVDDLNCDGGIHRCVHCGNGNVRYMEICFHKPSGRNVAFGSDCVARLGFKGHNEFKIEHIRSHANNMARAAAKLKARKEFLLKHEGLEEALTKGVERGNPFVAKMDVAVYEYGRLSEAQIAAVMDSARRDAEIAARKAKWKAEKAAAGPVPTGKRIEFTGVILSFKVVDTGFGPTTKMLVKLENGSKIWTSRPIALAADKGDTVKLRATVEASDTDKTFGFAKRPHLLEHKPVNQPA